jgi:LL-diaminopimelate aminotransferase
VRIISLGIGDTTEPIPAPIAKALEKAAAGLGTKEGYSGYGAEQGQGALREALSAAFYPGMIKASELFVSDGSKCDITRLQLMFGAGKTIALQDPSYPAYVDSSVIMGQTNGFNAANSQYGNIVYMPCNPANGFFPDLNAAKAADIIFFCSPNNPTGNAATREQLTELVAFAKRTGAIIIYDAAYAIYIDRPECPKTIYEIPGANEVAIETCSFSKYAGFTGVRLGWTVVPEALRYADGTPVISDWNRIMTTCFNGASNVAQAGGLACVQPAGLQAMRDLVAFYKGNAKIIYDALKALGLSVYGGTDAPYVWVHFPGRSSWDVFAEILEGANVVTTPGSGFGPAVRAGGPLACVLHAHACFACASGRGLHPHLLLRPPRGRAGGGGAPQEGAQEVSAALVLTFELWPHVKST